MVDRYLSSRSSREAPVLASILRPLFLPTQVISKWQYPLFCHTAFPVFFSIPLNFYFFLFVSDRSVRILTGSVYKCVSNICACMCLWVYFFFPFFHVKSYFCSYGYEHYSPVITSLLAAMDGGVNCRKYISVVHYLCNPWNCDPLCNGESVDGYFCGKLYQMIIHFEFHVI